MPLDWERIKAICFDVDGTLSDTDNHVIAQIVNPLRGIHWLFPESAQNKLARAVVMAVETPGNFLYNLADRVGIDQTMLSLSDWLNRHALHRTPERFWIIPGVEDLLNWFGNCFPLSIVSARSRSGTEAFLNQFELTTKFKAVATSQTCRHTKPFPDPVLWAADRMGVPPANCLMVGDTVVDIRAGRAAGAQTAGVLCGFGTRRELERAGADVIFDSTPDLVEAYHTHHPKWKDVQQ
jgi:phosphoglycolate phosphatase-like HAD superfamily hydrolase